MQKNTTIQFKLLDNIILLATAGSTGVGRSHTLQFFHGSEVAFWKNAEDHLASILMAISVETNSEIILESTANGKEGMFYELCIDAMANKNNFQFIFIPWFWHDYYVINDFSNYEISKAWLEYQKLYSLSNQQLGWAYLKNQILCKITGENNQDGPCITFKREFPAKPEEAFSIKDDNNFIKSIELIKSALDLTEFNNCSMNLLNNKSNNILALKKRLHLNASIILGVDVARGGGDYSWIIDRQGEFLGFNVNEKVNIVDTMKIAYWIASYINKFDPDKVIIDAGGGGIAVVDKLSEMGYQNITTAVNFASRANNQQKFLNKRAEIWWHLKEFINTGGYIINDRELLKQISSVKYQYNLKGQLQLESKRELRSNLKGSPDGGDAAALTFASYINNKSIIISDNNYDPLTW
ncbi:hypothetical protein ACFX5K_02810 [Rickettsiales bacterium LUAb2]